MDLLNVISPFKAADKLKIDSWDDIEKTRNPRTFHAFINPDEISLNYTVLTEQNPTTGRTGNAGPFLGTMPFEVTLKFFLDGTNANGVLINVKDKIIEFYQATGYDGNSHRTRFLRIIWPGLMWYRPNQFAFNCILKTASIQYKLFGKSGEPLRAVITATFIESRSITEIEEDEDNKSADLTHVRVVKEGDTLPAMVQNIYGDFRYYLEVARVNNLKNFRDLKPGDKLVFPPFENNVKQPGNG